MKNKVIEKYKENSKKNIKNENLYLYTQIFVTVFMLLVIIKRYLVTIFILPYFYMKVNCFWLLF